MSRNETKTVSVIQVYKIVTATLTCSVGIREGEAAVTHLKHWWGE